MATHQFYHNECKMNAACVMWRSQSAELSSCRKWCFRSSKQSVNLQQEKWSSRNQNLNFEVCGNRYPECKRSTPQNKRSCPSAGRRPADVVEAKNNEKWKASTAQSLPRCDLNFGDFARVLGSGLSIQGPLAAIREALVMSCYDHDDEESSPGEESETLCSTLRCVGRHRCATCGPPQH